MRIVRKVSGKRPDRTPDKNADMVSNKKAAIAPPAVRDYTGLQPPVCRCS